jgi:hypothetical protein
MNYETENIKYITCCKNCNNKRIKEDRTSFYKNKQLALENKIFCKYCKIIKDNECFNIIKINGGEYRRKRCKDCYNNYAKEYRKKKVINNETKSI